MDTSTHARYAELAQQHAQQGLSPADAAAAATAALRAEGAASSADGGEGMRDPVPDSKRRKTGGAGGQHTGDGGTAIAAGGGFSFNVGGGLSSNAGGHTAVGLPSDTGGAGGESKESGAHQGPGEGVNNPDGSLNIFRSASLPVDVALRIIGLGALTAKVGGSIHSVFGGNGVPEKRVFAFLVPTQANYADPLRAGVEGLRAACHGAWVLVERQLESVFLPALLCALGEGGGGGGGGGGKGGSSGGSGKGGKGGKDGGTQVHHMYGEKGVPATVAAALAVYRNASCLVGVLAFAASVGKRGDVMEGVVRGERGLVVEINWGGETSRGTGGTLPVGDLNMPGLRVLDLSSNRYRCKNLTGDLAQLQLPVGLKDLNLRGCSALTGDLAQLQLPVGVQNLNLRGCNALMGAVDKLLLPDGMQSVNFKDCEGLTGDLAQLQLPVGLKNLNLHGTKVAGDLAQLQLPVGLKDLNLHGTKVAGDLAQLQLPVGLKDLNLHGTKVAGDLAQLQLPVGLQNLNLHGTKVAGDLAQLQLPVGMQNLKLGGCNALTGAVDKIVLPEGMQTVDFSGCSGLTGTVDKVVLPEGMHMVDFCKAPNCTALTGTLPASERAKVKYYRDPHGGIGPI
jgi:hypothetical protein